RDAKAFAAAKPVRMLVSDAWQLDRRAFWPRLRLRLPGLAGLLGLLPAPQHLELEDPRREQPLGRQAELPLLLDGCLEGGKPRFVLRLSKSRDPREEPSRLIVCRVCHASFP